MYAVTVEFTIDPAYRDAFMKAMTENAAASLAREPGCRQFDICVAVDDPDRVFLYELYNDRRAFDAHLVTEHFKRFDVDVGSWIKRKSVGLWNRALPAKD